MFEHARPRGRGPVSIGTITILTSLFIVSMLAGKPRAQDPVRLAGQPFAITPEFEPERRSIAFKGAVPSAMLTVGGVTRVNGVAFSPDGKTLAVGDGPMRPVCTRGGLPPINENGGLVRLIDPATGRVRMTLSPNKMPGHEYSVDQLVYATDGKTLIARGTEIDRTKEEELTLGTFTLWDTANGQRLARVIGKEGRTSRIRSAVSPSGNGFAVVRDDEAIRVWLAPSARECPLIKFLERRKPTDDSVAEIQFSPDGRLIAVGCRQGDVRLFEAETGRLYARFPGRERDGKPFSIGSLSFSPDCSLLAAGGSILRDVGDKWVATCETTIFDVRRRRENTILRGRSEEDFFSMTFLGDEKTLVTGSADGSIRLWDTTTGKERAVYKGRGSYVRDLRFAPDGKTLAALNEGPISLWNTSSGSRSVDLLGHFTKVTDLSFSPDGRTLASAGGSLKLWDLRAAIAPRVDDGHLYEVTCVSFSPDSRSLASASMDQTAKLWDVAQQRPSFTLRGHQDAIYSLAYRPDGQSVASGDGDGVIKLWDTATGKETASFQAHTIGVGALAYSPDGKTLASATGLAGYQERYGELKLWDGKTGNARTASERFPFEVEALAFAPSGATLAIGCGDGSVILIGAASGKQRARLTAPLIPDEVEGIKCLAYSPDGKTLAAGRCDHTIPLWDVTHAEGRLAGTLQLEEFVVALAFSPDSKYVVASDRDNNLKVWDVANQKEVASTKGETDWFTSVSISFDGKRLAAGNRDASILIWDFEKILATHRFPK